MSEYVPRDILPDLWEEILKRHWSFLETEESLQKLEERKKLEGCLKAFLCIVPHDRKFFLPETADVLRKTILELDEFTAYKAMVGFEAISQYANNLFTKPWRKEYRVIKMYSGFFQHEVKANLLDSVKLFEAMGYRQVSSQVLELEGPICPDQVTNVSRDAMAAYVECQIMKHIYSGITALGLSCTWQDVFHYRENHTGGSSQAIKGFAYSLQERRFAKEKASKSDNTYATIQHGHTAATTGLQPMSKCQNCAPFHHQIMQHLPPQQQQLFNGQCAVHSNNNINNNNGCALHANNNNLALQPTHSLYDNNGKMLASYPAANYQQHAFVAPGVHHHEAHAHGHLMPHSRSLEHYSEPPAAPPLLPHRHSFDQHPQGCLAHPHHYQYAQSQHLYESPYDCIDGLDSSSGGPSYAAVGGPSNYSYTAAYAHPYNVSGNRYPLPYNISNQLNTHYDTPAAGDHQFVDDYVISDATNYTCNYHPTAIQQQQQQSSLQDSSLLPTRHNFSKDYQVNRQRSFPPDLHHLIDFDDSARLTDHDFHAQLHTRSQNNSFDYEHERERCERMVKHRGATERHDSSTALATDLNRLSLNSTYAQPKDAIGGKQTLQQQSENVPGNYVYSKPSAKEVDNPSNGGTVSEQQRCGQRYARDDAVAIKTTDKYLRNAENKEEFIEFNRKMHKELSEQRAAAGTDHRLVNDLQNNTTQDGAAAVLMSDRETSDVSYESNPFDGSRSDSAARAQRSPTQAIKNQDGVGSFESWNYVFQNLDRSGYSRDLGERGDLLVESLHLDSLNGPTTSSAAANGSVDKRRSSHVQVAESSSKAPERSMNGSDKSQYKQEQLFTSASAETRLASTKSGSAKVDKSILKQSKSNNASSNSASAAGKPKMKSALKSTLKTTATSNVNNNNNESHIQQHQNKTSQKNYNQSAKRQPNSNRVVKHPPPVATQVIITSPNEWSCRFCTFLNPDTKRICEMCCRSKDFNVDAVVVANTPTCV